MHTRSVQLDIRQIFGLHWACYGRIGDTKDVNLDESDIIDDLRRWKSATKLRPEDRSLQLIYHVRARARLQMHAFQDSRETISEQQLRFEVRSMLVEKKGKKKQKIQISMYHLVLVANVAISRRKTNPHSARYAVDSARTDTCCRVPRNPSLRPANETSPTSETSSRYHRP